MSNILLITSSPRGPESLSTRYAIQLAEGLSQRLSATLVTRDLTSSPAPHIGPAYIEGRMKPEGARNPEEAEAVDQAASLVSELQEADVIVLGSGMMNFGPSSQLKAWIDNITWPGLTFSYEGGVPQGLLSGKKVYLVTAAGGVFSEGPYAAFDFQTGYLMHLLNFIGLTEIELVRIEGTVMGPAAVEAALALAASKVSSLLTMAG